MRSGLLFVDKPAGLTSHDVVARVRRAARTKRVGHAGTLDPFATGLLVLAIGSATRLLQFVNGEPKVYLTEIAFGVETDTDDATGRDVRNAANPSSPDVLSAIATLTGRIQQLPPAFSAKHVDGQRAYDLARKGQSVALQPVEVSVHAWEVMALSPDRVVARISCSGGTYIRALARDLGRLAGTAAHCRSLRRISSGPALVDDAVPLELLPPGSVDDETVPLVNPLHVLVGMPRFVLDGDQQRRLVQGRVLDAPHMDGSQVVFVDAHDRVLGVGERLSDQPDSPLVRWQPRVVLDVSEASAT